MLSIPLLIHSIWKEVDGSYWFKGRWYMIPEETNAGRQPHNLRRELYRTNDFADIEVMIVILSDHYKLHS